MRNTMIATLIGLGVAASATAGADMFAFKVSANPQVVVRGLPAEVSGEIYNASGRPVKIAYDIQPFSGGPGEGFHVFARTTDASGNERVCAGPMAYVIQITEETLPPGWHKRLDLPLCIEAPGTYKVEVVASSDPATYSRQIGPDVWSGEVRSEPFTVTIEEPTGVDRAAYEYFQGHIMHVRASWPTGTAVDRPDLILQMFPTSTYAAYVVWCSTAKGITQGVPSNILYGLHSGFAGVVLSVPCSEPPCPAGKPSSWVERYGEAGVAWRQKWIDIVLKAHPDIWFADELKFRVALDQFILGNPSLGAASLEALAKNGRPDVAEKAKQLLALAKENGVVQ